LVDAHVRITDNSHVNHPLRGPTMKFYLVSDGENSVIQPDEGIKIPSSMIRGGVEAETWLDAKAAFGFELTPLQARMLPLDHAGREAMQRRSA
jgi:hypothetical protein